MKNRLLAILLAVLTVTALPAFVRAADEAQQAITHGGAPAEGAAAGGHTAAGHGSGAAGMPPSVNEGLVTAIVTLVVFVTLLILLTRFAFGPISKGLADREAKIRRDIQEAERARAAADAANRDYQNQLAKAGDEVRAILDKAQADAQAVATRIKMQAQQEAEEAKERALKDIDASRRAAVAEIHEHAATLSTSIAEKILRRNLNADDQRELVRQSLDQLGSMN